MLQVTNLKATLAEENLAILKGINLTINAGEIHVILGPNGSGKSTLGRVILGDERYEVNEGSIDFEGTDFLELDPSERAQAGFFLTFQSPPEIDGVSVKEFLFAAKKANDPEFTSSFKLKKQLSANFEDLRLPTEFIDREANLGFSGGERKKMEVASLLTLQPKLAFLDEIDSGVDIDTIRSIGASLRAFMQDQTRSILLVSHSDKLFDEIEATHVHIFNQGKIIKSGNKELIAEIQKNGFDAYIKSQNPLKVLA